MSMASARCSICHCRHTYRRRILRGSGRVNSPWKNIRLKRNSCGGDFAERMLKSTTEPPNRLCWKAFWRGVTGAWRKRSIGPTNSAVALTTPASISISAAGKRRLRIQVFQ